MKAQRMLGRLLLEALIPGLAARVAAGACAGALAVVAARLYGAGEPPTAFEQAFPGAPGMRCYAGARRPSGE